MINATDLMIGDYVTFRDAPDTPIKIWGISEDGTAFAFIDKEKALEEIAIDDEIIGIPLTPEILEKNGFINDSYYNECVADGQFVQVQIWAYREENILIDWDGYTLRVVNDFGHPGEELTLQDSICVHELQHALILCGIDKEIIL